MRERWYWLDWLRVLAMGAIFLFHSSAPFSYFPWDVMNPTPNLGFTVFGLFILGWVMPLFFVVSGISVIFLSDKSECLTIHQGAIGTTCDSFRLRRFASCFARGRLLSRSILRRFCGRFFPFLFWAVLHQGSFPST